MSATRKTTAKDTATKATETATAAMNDTFEKMTENFTNFGAFGQENVEAVIESATTVAKGFEKIANESADYAKKQVESSTEKFQSLSKAKTPQEFFDAQSDFVRVAMEAQIGQVNKVSDMMLAMSRDAAQPLSKRYTALVEMMQQR